jgi:hypothetical protein
MVHLTRTIFFPHLSLTLMWKNHRYTPEMSNIDLTKTKKGEKGDTLQIPARS